MKKLTKALSVILVTIMTLSLFSIVGFALPTEIEAGSSVSSATNIPEYETEYASSLETGAEVDWYKFTTKSEDAYYFISFSNYNIAGSGAGASYGLNLYLCDKFENVYKHVYVGKEKTKSYNIRLENNSTYYIKILNGSVTQNTGNYGFNISIKYDNVPNSMSKANAINFNSKVVSSMDGTGDVDWFSITTPDLNGKYKFTFQNNEIGMESSSGTGYAANLYLYDINSRELGHVDVGKNKNKSFEVELEKNTTYYLKVVVGDYVVQYLGTYEVTVKTDAVSTPTPDPEPTPTPDPTPDKPNEDGFDIVEDLLVPIYEFFMNIINWILDLFM